MPPALTSQPSVFVAGLSLLAFVLAFYALIARERRTPYITTNTVYWTAISVLSAAFMSGSAELIRTRWPSGAGLVDLGAALLLVLALLHVIWRILCLKNSHIAFRTDKLFKNLRPYRLARRGLRSLKGRPSYEHNAQHMSSELLASLLESPELPQEPLQAAIRNAKEQSNNRVLALSAGYSVSYRSEATATLVDLAVRFLRHNCFVQITTCVRHPVELVRALKAAWLAIPNAPAWESIATSVVVVDAFTPHFGFTDTVHEEAKALVVKEGVHFVDSSPSYAGIHTANAAAFNVFKEQHATSDRRPSLIVYEGAAALIDLESEEQYRIFVRHVAPSERLWGGMFTVFLEFAPTADTIGLLKSYVDLYVDRVASGSASDSVRS